MKHNRIVFCALIATIAFASENAHSLNCSGQTQYNWANYRGAAGNSVVHPANAFSIDCTHNGLTYSAATMLRNPDNRPDSGETMVFRQAAVSKNSGQTTWSLGMLHNATGIAGANHTFWYNAYPQDEPTVLVDWRSTVSLMIQQLVGVTARHNLDMKEGVLELSSTLGWGVDSQFLIFGKRLAGYGLSAGRGVGPAPSFIADATYVARSDARGNWAVGIQGGRLAEGYQGTVAAESRIGLHVERTLTHSQGASTYFGGEIYRMSHPGGLPMQHDYFVGTAGFIHYRPINERFTSYVASSLNGDSIDGLFTSVEAGMRWNVIKNLFLTTAAGYEKPLGGGLPQSDQFGFYGGLQYRFGSN